MPNQENIEPYRFESGSKAREAGRKGGIASGKSKRAKKTMRELAELMLDSRATGNSRKSARALGSMLDDDDLTNAAAVIAGQMRSAMKGNTQAARWLSEIAGHAVAQEEEEDELSKALRELGESM